MIEFNSKNIKRWMMMGTRNAFGSFLTEIAADHPNDCRLHKEYWLGKV